MIDIGRGEPIVLVPGVQGRWEWTRAAVERLAQDYRVIAYSLSDERSSGFPCDPALGFQNYVQQVGQVMDRAGVATATIVGVSYGGLIATEFAARMPERVSRLVLASALPIDWHPDRRARFFLRAPRLLSPLFVASAPLRFEPEIRKAIPEWRQRVRFISRQTRNVLGAPASPGKMARRVRWAEAHHFAGTDAVRAPVLVVTGEPGLDRVVPVEVSRRNIERFPGARHVVIPRTGHLGIVTQPDEFRTVMRDFLGSGR
jgi:pimeloyl-ACP methyl ester carboxylesterase